MRQSIPFMSAAHTHDSGLLWFITHVHNKGLSPLNRAGVTGAQEGTLMKRHYFTSYSLFALIGLILSQLAVVYASPSTADSVLFCAPFDYEQWRRDRPHPAGKRLVDRNVGEPRTVRMIYFLPNDRPFRQEVIDLMKVRIREVQNFYAEQMQAHGYGNTTFRFETDAQGEPLVHHVDGQHPERHYENDTMGEVLDEIFFGEGPLQFDVLENDCLIVIDNSTDTIGVGGYGQGGVNSDFRQRGGISLVPSDLLFSTIAHELGHTFGLGHDFRDDAYIMSYGGNKGQLSACAAEFLSVHPYFNADIPLGGKTFLHKGGGFSYQFSSPSTIEMISPLVRRKGETSIPIQVKVRDADGLHQVILIVGRIPGVKECHGLEGEKEAVVEFDYDGYMPDSGLGFGNYAIQRLWIQAIDVLGNEKLKSFELIDEGLKEPAELEHGDRVTSVSFSPDGRLLATGGGAVGVAKLWDVSSGKRVAEFPHRGYYRVYGLVTFSPDGKLLTTMGEAGVAKLWDVSSGKRVAVLNHGDRVTSVSFSPDGKLLATGGKGKVNLWDVSSGEHVALVLSSEFTALFKRVIFSPDSRLLATVGSWKVELWDASSGERVALLPYEGNGSFDSVSFSPDGRLLAAGGDPWTPVVKLWDVSTGQSIATLAGHGLVAFSPNGRLLAAFRQPLIKAGGGRSLVERLSCGTYRRANPSPLLEEKTFIMFPLYPFLPTVNCWL